MAANDRQEDDKSDTRRAHKRQARGRHGKPTRTILGKLAKSGGDVADTRVAFQKTLMS